MQRIILDTNVVVSALIQKNYPYLIVEYCLEGNATLCISSPILQEYIEGLSRPKFSKFPDFKKNAEFLLTCLSEIAEIHEPKIELSYIQDEPDNRFLELAEATKADFIITGNTTDFTMRTYKKTKIVSPKAFWEDYNNVSSI